MSDKYIEIKGARVNNLKNIDLKIPKDKLIVMTGLSGSGKSSLAFDTIYAEGQRRYVESLSAYARQFLNNVNKPDVDSIEGLSPAISIDQKTTNKNPRSTVGTITEIYDYLRLLYARIGHAYCPNHGIEISSQTVNQMCDKVMAYPLDTRVVVMSPVAHMEKGRHEKIFDILKKEGLSKARIDGEIYDLDEVPELDKNKKHNIEAIIDRLKLKADSRTRLYDSIEAACKLSDGRCVIGVDEKELVFSEHLACPECEFSIPKLEPALFSFNSPQGACDVCHGIGFLQQVSIDLLVPDDSLSINEGGIRYYKNIKGTDNIEWQTFEILCKHYNIDLDKPFRDLSEEEKDIILHGSKGPVQYEIVSSSGNTYKRNTYIEGVQDLIERRYLETSSSWNKDYYGSYMMDIVCPKCHGRRLSEIALAVKVGGLNIDEICAFTVSELYDFLKSLELSDTEAHIANLVLKEINNRLEFLINVGLDYLTLNRYSASLSGGELQRIRLATQIGSSRTYNTPVKCEPI